jgi:hypothetical protein
MGYVFAIGTCCGCRGKFSFNPMKVPSIRIDGSREPICRTCVERANPQRIANGLEPIMFAADAYDACDEGELSYD